VSSNLFIYFSEPVKSKTAIEIYDAGGNKVLHGTLEINATTYSTNVSHYPSGVYILKIKSINTIANYKIVKR
jgi:hypothetical protein